MALIICNPVGGDSTAKQFVEAHVLPLLKANDVPIARIVETEHAGHAGTAAFEFVDSTVSGPLDIIVASGDGTIHDIVTTIALAPSYKNRSPATPAQVNLVLVPCGTANALYSSLFLPKPEDDPVQYKLQGIHAFIKQAKRVPLTLAITDIIAPPRSGGSAPVREKTTVSVVVTSIALHASILHDSEVLRTEIPSIERFKVAARQNITRWYSGCAKLFPSSSTGVVEIWNPFDKEFVPHAESEEDNPHVDIDGPFAYFLSTVNVDRLEPAFQIAPLVTAEPRTGALLDIVVVRPYRDASLSGLEAEEERQVFAEKSGEVLRAAYQSGNHINLRYDPTGKVVSEGEGELVVEYFRCGGWEWIPDTEDEKAHLLCNDGLINTIPKGGKAKTMAAAPSGESGFIVYV
ncbi:ATP-NAD kinase-like domain-containing protein [Thelephora terrestris]|uniref:ATP-NAD kinase-like domain-containing protein n=1 Tax=Thelephora terrestris TaxID=56493 RepID=A0A9P6HQA7_9AGAM|nr:ATP-NAD kinase-like domain-containing protein [Thelephora terrestris]